VSGSGTVGGTLVASTVNSANGYQIGATSVFRVNSYGLFLGSSAGVNVTGTSNVFVGVQAGQYGTTGGGNTYVGQSAGTSNQAGSNNTFIGSSSGIQHNGGSYNTFVGSSSGQSTGSGIYNTYIGYLAGRYNTGNYNVYLGANAGSTPTAENNVMRLGSGVTSTYIAGIYGVNVSNGVPMYVASTGQVGSVGSSRTFKENIADMGETTGNLLKLRPVTFHYKKEYDSSDVRPLQYGLIAEEVAEVYPELVAYDADRNPYTVKYQFLAPMLLNEVQKQHAVIQEQKEKIEALEKRLERLEALIGLR